MPRHLRLTHAEFVDDAADRARALPQQFDDAKPVRLGDRTEPKLYRVDVHVPQYT